MAVMCGLLSEYANEKIDVARTMLMVLTHDLVEIDAGDTYAYDEKGNASKKERERKAADRIYALLPEDQAKMARELWEEFEEGKTPEARFANTLDKIQPVLLNDAAGGISWRAHGVSDRQILGRNRNTHLGSETLWEYTRELIGTEYREWELSERRRTVMSEQTLDQELIRERARLAWERIASIRETPDVTAPYDRYFQKMAEFILEMGKTVSDPKREHR